MPLLPATGTAIAMGRVRKSFNNVAPAAGNNISLRGTLGGYLSITTGSVSLSSRFGGRTNPYTY